MVHWIAIFDPYRGSRSIFCGSVSNLDTILESLDRNGSYRGFLMEIFDPLPAKEGQDGIKTGVNIQPYIMGFHITLVPSPHQAGLVCV